MVDLKKTAHIIRLSLLFTLSNFHFLSFIFVNFEQLSLIVLVPLLLLTKNYVDRFVFIIDFKQISRIAHSLCCWL